MSKPRKTLTDAERAQRRFDAAMARIDRDTATIETEEDVRKVRKSIHKAEDQAYAVFGAVGAERRIAAVNARWEAVRVAAAAAEERRIAAGYAKVAEMEREYRIQRKQEWWRQ